MAKMRLEDVTFAYGALPVVRQISLALNSGVFYGIVGGPNGGRVNPPSSNYLTVL